MRLFVEFILTGREPGTSGQLSRLTWTNTREGTANRLVRETGLPQDTVMAWFVEGRRAIRRSTWTYQDSIDMGAQWKEGEWSESVEQLVMLAAPEFIDAIANQVSSDRAPSLPTRLNRPRLDFLIMACYAREE